MSGIIVLFLFSALFAALALTSVFVMTHYSSATTSDKKSIPNFFLAVIILFISSGALGMILFLSSAHNIDEYLTEKFICERNIDTENEECVIDFKVIKKDDTN